MTTRPYNGFTPADRHDGSLWARAAREAGNLPELATACMNCGQTEGRIEGHSEDYSAPYGEHIGAYTFCFWCHRMLHARFSKPAAFARYLAALRAGETFAPIYENSYARINPFLAGRAVETTKGPARGELLFDRMELADNQEEPPAYLRERFEKHLEIVRRGAVVEVASARDPKQTYRMHRTPSGRWRHEHGQECSAVKHRRNCRHGAAAEALFTSGHVVAQISAPVPAPADRRGQLRLF